MQKVIIIGRPNVGKSSLFNRFVGQRIAITSDISGTTRDTNKTIVEIFDKQAILIDSGGLDESSELFKNVQEKTLNEAKNSDLIIFMVDGKMMPDEIDKKILYSLNSLKKPICLVVNKVDSKKDEERSGEFIEFGVKNIFNISVSHNAGIDELKYWIYKFLKDEIRPDLEENFDDFINNLDLKDEKNIEDFENKNIKVGIIGRVNVGKSSLLNALVKDNRSVVSNVAGTTIDPVNETYVYENKIFEFVDTAGIRKRGKIEGIEKFALNRTEKVLENSDIALLVLDSSENFTELDERIAGIASKFSLGIIVIFNKWDKNIQDFDKLSKDFKDKFKFLSYAPIISVSATGGKRVHKIYDLILEVYKNYTQKIPTSKLNLVIEEATNSHPIPSDKGKKVKIYYAAQFGFAPPKIALVMNRPNSLHFSYKRYLANKLRENFNLSGVGIEIFARAKGAKKDENE